MSDSYRIKQLNNLIQQLFSEILQKEGNFPENYFITVTKAETSKDLANVKIFISVYPEITKEIKEYFQKNIFFLQQILNKKLNIHPVPKIIIVYDESEKKAAKIESLLYQAKKELKKQNKKSSKNKN